MRAHLAVAAAVLVGVATFPSASRAQGAPVVVEAPVRFGGALNLGASFPTVAIKNAGERGQGSFFVDARAMLDLANFVEIGGAAAAALPGREGADLVGSVGLEVRVAPIAIGPVHPYLGVSGGYAFLELKQKCLDVGFGCDDKAGSGGAMIGPLAGVRFDLTRGRRRISIYGELDYQKVFTTPASLDRVVVKVGPGVLF